jgi:hypothetical protein
MGGEGREAREGGTGVVKKGREAEQGARAHAPPAWRPRLSGTPARRHPAPPAAAAAARRRCRRPTCSCSSTSRPIAPFAATQRARKSATRPSHWRTRGSSWPRWPSWIASSAAAASCTWRGGVAGGKAGARHELLRCPHRPPFWLSSRLAEQQAQLEGIARRIISRCPPRHSA